MGQKRKSERRGSASRADSMNVRSAFIVNMFREFPDRVFSMKQLAAASGGNSKEGRYMVRDIVEALIEGGVVESHGRDKFQLSSSPKDAATLGSG